MGPIRDLKFIFYTGHARYFSGEGAPYIILQVFGPLLGPGPDPYSGFNL